MKNVEKSSIEYFACCRNQSITKLCAYYLNEFVTSIVSKLVPI